MAHWHVFERDVIRETVDGVRGFRCACGHWEPVIGRTEGERKSLPVTPPAHETYRVIRRISFRRWSA